MQEQMLTGKEKPITRVKWGNRKLGVNLNEEKRQEVLTTQMAQFLSNRNQCSSKLPAPQNCTMNTWQVYKYLPEVPRQTQSYNQAQQILSFLCKERKPLTDDKNSLILPLLNKLNLFCLKIVSHKMKRFYFDKFPLLPYSYHEVCRRRKEPGSR